MEQTYMRKKPLASQRPEAALDSSRSAAPSLDALKMGAVQPTQEMLGRPVDLPGAIRAKMEASFGADLSAVRLYESQAVADAGANAVAQGSRIAFAPGKLDFSSSSGQALLGHELSHVVSQARGEVIGSGFLNDHALEARADREGAMAAAGEQVYAGPVTTALSSASAAPAAGPMQASKSTSKGKKHFDRTQKYEEMLRTHNLSQSQIKRYQKKLDSAKWWMNYWMPPQSPDKAIAKGRKHYDKMVAYEDLLADSSLPDATRAQYEAQRKDAEQWMKFWGQWITPEAAVEASREHHEKGMDLAGKTFSYFMWDPFEHHIEEARNISPDLKNELEWQTFLLPYGSDPSRQSSDRMGIQTSAYGRALSVANFSAPMEERDAAQSELTAFMKRFRRVWGNR